jgi:hypothetical protein
MTGAGILTLSVFGAALAAPSLCARYREFQLGMNLPAVVKANFRP